MINSDKNQQQATVHISVKKPIDSKKTRQAIGYDIVMLFILVIDLTLIFIDKLLMSEFLKSFAIWLVNHFDNVALISFIRTFSHEGFIIPIGYSNFAITINHTYLSLLGGVFTLFFTIELLIRWGRAIIHKAYYRWFFFPFIHWYEVIGCLPQFRMLRLLRVVIIGRRLYQLGYPVFPKKWLKSLAFYYDVILEEISDRVVLKVLENVRLQMSNSENNQALVKKLIDNNRSNINDVVLTMLRTELAPKLRSELMPVDKQSPVAKHVGIAVADAMAKTPEIDMVLSKIPIAGSMIQSQMMGISNKVGYNIAEAVSYQLLDDEVLDEVFISVAHGVSQINFNQPELEALIGDIIEESLTAFEEQVKVQQWRQQLDSE